MNGWSLPSIGISDGDKASFSGVAGSILFGKSIQDFAGVNGYEIVAGPDFSGAGIHSIQSYVVKYESDRNDLSNVYAAGFAPELDEPYLTPFIYLVERQLIWNYVLKWGRMPACNGK